jgi:phage host-nuclease inhibitor protein Gam
MGVSVQETGLSVRSGDDPPDVATIDVCGSDGSFLKTYRMDECEILDGWIVSPEGEVIGSVHVPNPFVKPDAFHVTDRKSADWVMAKKAEIAGNRVSIAAQYRAAVANFERLDKQEAAKEAALARRFDGELEAWAKEWLAGGKARSVQLLHGELAFRKSQGTTKITDMVRAVAFVREVGGAEDVKVVETVTATTLKKLASATFADGIANPEFFAFVETSGPRDNFKIETGVSLG